MKILLNVTKATEAYLPTTYNYLKPTSTEEKGEEESEEENFDINSGRDVKTITAFGKEVASWKDLQSNISTATTGTKIKNENVVREITQAGIFDGFCLDFTLFLSEHTGINLTNNKQVHPKTEISKTSHGINVLKSHRYYTGQDTQKTSFTEQENTFSNDGEPLVTIQMYILFHNDGITQYITSVDFCNAEFEQEVLKRFATSISQVKNKDKVLTEAEAHLIIAALGTVNIEDSLIEKAFLILAKEKLLTKLSQLASQFNGTKETIEKNIDNAANLEKLAEIFSSEIKEKKQENTSTTKNNAGWFPFFQTLPFFTEKTAMQHVSIAVIIGFDFSIIPKAFGS